MAVLGLTYSLISLHSGAMEAAILENLRELCNKNRRINLGFKMQA